MFSEAAGEGREPSEAPALAAVLPPGTDANELTPTDAGCVKSEAGPLPAIEPEISKEASLAAVAAGADPIEDDGNADAEVDAADDEEPAPEWLRVAVLPEVALWRSRSSSISMVKWWLSCMG